MADLTFYAAKIAECLRLLESSNDPLYRDVYQAMADEFAEKYAALSRRVAEQTALATPPSPLLSRVAPAAPPQPKPPTGQPHAAGEAPAQGQRATSMRRR
jgi:hypothetical protein